MGSVWGLGVSGGLIQRLLALAADVRTDTVTVDGIAVRVREPSAAVHSRYAQLWDAGDGDGAVASLFRSCVIDEAGAPALNDEQALVLARARSGLGAPILQAIFRLVPKQKEPDAPGADGVQDLGAPGAAPV